MRFFRCVVALSFLLLGMPHFAHALNMNILDPGPGGELLTSNTFDVSFASCSDYSSPSAPVSADGCFEGVNATGLIPGNPAQTWTSLVLTFVDPTDVLGMNDITCGVLGSSFSIFGSSSCTETGDTYTLSFSSGSIAPGQSFFIEEDGISADEFPEGTAVAGVGTPEPGSGLLLATGLAMFGMVAFAQRRKLLADGTQR